MRYIKNTIFTVLLTTLPLFYSCQDGVNIFSKSDDVDLGKQLNQEIHNNSAEYPIYHGDPSVKNYINQRIFSEVLSSPQIESKDIYPYQMEIIDDDSTLNAFALPGGFIYVYTGLLKYLDSEAALAGVLGHEIAHAELRHATQRMTAQYGVSFLLSLILGEDPSTLEQIASNLFVGLAFLANSRSDESQADRYSFKYLQDTRYYAGGVKFFFEEMRNDGLVSSNSSKIETFLSTHPDPISRIDDINQMIQQANLPLLTNSDSGANIFKDEYQTNVKIKIH